MDYTIKLDKHDLTRIKRVLKDELERELKSRRVCTLQNDYIGAELADYEATQLMDLMNKLEKASW